MSRSDTHISSDGACLEVVGPGPTRLRSADGDPVGATAAFFISRSSSATPPPTNVTIKGLRLFVRPGVCDGIAVYGGDVRIAGVWVEGSPLDDVYIGGRTNLIRVAHDVLVTHSVLSGAERNAISVTSATDVRITDNVLAGAGSRGDAGPGAGIDVEPNSPTDPISDVIIEDNVIAGNRAAGVELALDPNAGLPERAGAISIIDNLLVGNSLARRGGAVSVAGGQRNGLGDVLIRDNRFYSNGGATISGAVHPSGRPSLERNARRTVRSG